MRRVNRVEPAGPARAYDTFRITAPISTHRRPATCDEVGCPHWAGGWVTNVDVTSELGQDQADYIRTHSARRYTETVPHPGTIRFEFGPGQTCFRAAEHTIPLEREPLYLRTGGIAHQRTGGQRRYDRGDQWVDDFQTNQDNLSKLRGE